jgi:hypothetical protein
MPGLNLPPTPFDVEIEGLSLMFCVTKVTSEIILDEWVWSRPKYKYVRESVDKQVLVPVSE